MRGKGQKGTEKEERGKQKKWRLFYGTEKYEWKGETGEEKRRKNGNFKEGNGNKENACSLLKIPGSASHDIRSFQDASSFHFLSIFDIILVV